MVILKKCFNCKEYFPSKLKDYVPYCPKCLPHREEYMIGHFKSTRNIPIFYFDVFDSDYPLDYGGYERVCRICGSRLLKKDGKYNWRRRHCKKHAGIYSPLYIYVWDATRSSFLSDNIEKNWIRIILTGMDQGIEKIIWSYKGYDDNQPERIYCSYNICEKCGKLTRAPEVHHRIPVHTLTKDNFKLIWDKSNLMCLCHKCHRGMDHKLKWTKEEKEKIFQRKYSKYKKLDEFL